MNLFALLDLWTWRKSWHTYIHLLYRGGKYTYFTHLTRKKAHCINHASIWFLCHTVSLNFVCNKRLMRLKLRCALGSECIQNKNKITLWKHVELRGSLPLIYQIHLFNKYSLGAQCLPEVVTPWITNSSFLQLACGLRGNTDVWKDIHEVVRAKIEMCPNC